MMKRIAIVDALIAASVLGVFSAGADWLWDHHLTDGDVVAGVLHGLLVFVVMALVVGRTIRRRGAVKRLLLTLPVAGAAIAAVFYPLAWLLGYLGALLATWVLMWIVIAWLARWVERTLQTIPQDPEPRLQAALVSGLLAAVFSGVSFWTISGIWTNPPVDPSYWFRALQWGYAFLPGFVGLFWLPRSR